MALAPGLATSTDPFPIENHGPQVNAPGLNYFVFALFLIFGGIASLKNVIMPGLKELFTLRFFEALLVQLCFFAAHAIIGIPVARLAKRLGYLRGAVAGLAAMTVGCLPFISVSLSPPRSCTQDWLRDASHRWLTAKA
jgi:FHS family L-fucose permease-like MFS transporter